MRTLQRDFKQAGETLGRRLLDTRLKKAYACLVAPASSSQNTVTDIAFGAGLSNLSHFHREFRAKYGAIPGELKVRH